MVNLTGTVLSSKSINISWEPPPNLEVLEYLLSLTPLYSSSEAVLQNTTSETSFIFSSLHPATFYYLSIAVRTIVRLQQPMNIIVELPPDGK